MSHLAATVPCVSIPYFCFGSNNQCDSFLRIRTYVHFALAGHFLLTLTCCVSRYTSYLPFHAHSRFPSFLILLGELDTPRVQRPQIDKYELTRLTELRYQNDSRSNFRRVIIVYTSSLTSSTLVCTLASGKWNFIPMATVTISRTDEPCSERGLVAYYVDFGCSSEDEWVDVLEWIADCI